MAEHLASDEQIIAMRLSALAHGDRQLAINCTLALEHRAHAQPARAYITGVINTLARELPMYDTYRRALDGKVVVLPNVEALDERTAFASRGFQYGAGFVTCGVRVRQQIDVDGQDRAEALRHLEDRLLEALADVRGLRDEIRAEEADAKNYRPSGAV